jgi:uncharacterized hydrophobic protein (TIGR00271 family)
VLLVRIYSPTALTPAVTSVLREAPTVSALAVVEGASVLPPGDLVLADVARETANDVIDRLLETGVQEQGAIQVETIRTWISRPGFDAERAAPGAGADVIVWADVVRRAYEESELTFAYVTFMTLATLIASIAIVLDSQILIIGAMVLGPEFGAVAALGIGLIRRRFTLLRHAVRTLVVGFAVAILLTTLIVLLGRWLGWLTEDDVSGPRPGTDFVYQPDRWSLVVAAIAGAAGVLAMTSGKAGGLVGVFISVTTIPAAGNVAIGLALGLGDEVWGSAQQLVVNITGMALAGWLMFIVQDEVWRRVSERARGRR